jgi:tetratricopeptide (TPR) repeat protein
MLDEEYLDAGTVLEEARPVWSKDEIWRGDCNDLYLAAMAEAKQGVRAYEHALDPKEAFASLAAALSADASRISELRCLIDAHALRHPDDAWLPYYRAGMHALLGEIEQADAAFATASALALDELDREQVRSTWVSAWFSAGKGLDAYREIGPKAETLNQLCEHYAAAYDANGLRQLLVAHRASGDDPTKLQAWDAEVAYLEKSYDVAAALFLSLDDSERESFGEWHAADRAIRSLARLGREREALQHVARQPESGFNVIWRAVIHGRAGRAEVAMIALEEAIREKTWRAEGLYLDDDLAELLLTPAFAPFRAIYPPPRGFYD